MEKAKEQNKESNNNNNNNNKKRYHRHKNHQKNHKKETAPTWDFERRGAELPETKADLMMILEEVNPEELLMVSLVKQNKELKVIKKVEDEPNDDNIDNIENPSEQTEKVKINLSRDCPICDKPIREIMYALHDYDHDQLAHFDCVYKKVLSSVKEKLINKRYLAYLGSGSFGIMDPGNGNKQHITLIEKIYPGAPLEELLHGDENIKDEEL